MDFVTSLLSLFISVIFDLWHIYREEFMATGDKIIVIYVPCVPCDSERTPGILCANNDDALKRFIFHL